MARGRQKGTAKLPRSRGTKNVNVGNMLGQSVFSEPVGLLSGKPGSGGGRGKRTGVRISMNKGGSRRRKAT